MLHLCAGTMASLGYFADDIVDKANFPDTPKDVPSYGDDAEIIASTDATYVPEAVKKFIADFHKAFRNKDLSGILALYEGAWNELSEKWYKNSSWPKVSHRATHSRRVFGW